MVSDLVSCTLVIEKRLVENRWLTAVGVMARAGVEGSDDTLAYVIRQPSVEVTHDDLRQYLAAHECAAPITFVILNDLGLEHGDRSHTVDRACAGSDSAAVERIVGDVWALALERPSVQADVSFVDLGGQSLEAMHVVSLLGAVFQMEFSIRPILENGTVASVARILRAADPSVDEIARLVENLRATQGEHSD